MYKALIQFRDLDGEIYNEGNSYPRGEVTDERIGQLLTANNGTKAPVIIAEEPPPPPNPAEMSIDELYQFAVRQGVEIPPDITAECQALRDKLAVFVGGLLGEEAGHSENFPVLPDGFDGFTRHQLEEYATAIGVDLTSARNNSERQSAIINAVQGQ